MIFQDDVEFAVASEEIKFMNPIINLIKMKSVISE
jgi:hypothetical protein